MIPAHQDGTKTLPATFMTPKEECVVAKRVDWGVCRTAPTDPERA